MALPIIEARNLSKCYHLWRRPADRLLGGLFQAGIRSAWLPFRLRQSMDQRAKALSRPFFALHDVSFSLGRGESLGIIGRNGSGKSTLLQILAGTLSPSSGEFRMGGRVAALLELGSGFNPEFTGRENVFLQAALAGVPAASMEVHFDEVAAFAGIGEFIDQPVKTYSSGMMVRLAFATQTMLRPDVFIVDEALAVGDVFFQAKCARFFQERLSEGMTLLFVSHDLASVKALCRQALVLDHGRAVFFGESPKAVSVFHELHTTVGRQKENVASPPSGAASLVQLPPGAVLRNWNSPAEIGIREVELVHCRVCNQAGEECRSFAVGEAFFIELYVRAHVALARLQFAIEIADRHNRVVYGVSTLHLGLGYQSLGADEMQRIRISFEPRLGHGEYVIDAAVGMGDRGDGAPEHHLHRVAHIAGLSIRHNGVKPGFLGPIDLGAQASVG